MKFLVAPASSQALMSSPVTLCLDLVAPFICTQVVVVLVRWDSRAGVVLVKETTITVCTIKGSLKRYERPITQSSTALYVCLLRFIPKKEQRLSQEIKNALTTANFDNCEEQLPTTNMPVSQQLTNT